MDPVLHLYVLDTHSGIQGSHTGIPLYVPGSGVWVPGTCTEASPEDELVIHSMAVFFHLVSHPSALNVDIQIGGKQNDKSDAHGNADDDGGGGRLPYDAGFCLNGDAVTVGVIDTAFPGILIPGVFDELGGVLLQNTHSVANLPGLKIGQPDVVVLGRPGIPCECLLKGEGLGARGLPDTFFPVQEGVCPSEIWVGVPSNLHDAFTRVYIVRFIQIDVLTIITIEIFTDPQSHVWLAAGTDPSSGPSWQVMFGGIVTMVLPLPLVSANSSSSVTLIGSPVHNTRIATITNPAMLFFVFGEKYLPEKVPEWQLKSSSIKRLTDLTITLNEHGGVKAWRNSKRWGRNLDVKRWRTEGTQWNVKLRCKVQTKL